MAFDPDSGAFKCSYVADSSISQPTEIFLSVSFYYPRGVDVTVAPSDAASFFLSASGSLLTVTALRNATLTVTVTAK
jgi:hypothetical protein